VGLRTKLERRFLRKSRKKERGARESDGHVYLRRQLGHVLDRRVAKFEASFGDHENWVATNTEIAG